MKPEQLQNWQPQATYEQLQIFINENPSLFMLLDEVWLKFQQTHEELFQAKQQITSSYATHMTPEQLEHYPISESQMAEFLPLFDQQSTHQNRPFGDNPIIQEHDWSLVDD